MKKILLLVPDLMFGNRIENTARHLGFRVANVATSDDMRAAIAREIPDLVLLTFDRTGDAWLRLAEAARDAGIKTVAFGSHMNIDAFKRAKELGCAEVLANSRLNSALPNLLAKWSG
ncbi:MAG: hypothetical protein ACM3JD_01205 [Rudaea sp.]